MHIIAVCLLNLHEEERMKPKNGVPVGWLPVYDESRDLREKKQDLILHPLERFDCTMPVGLNFLTNGQSVQRKL